MKIQKAGFEFWCDRREGDDVSSCGFVIFKWMEDKEWKMC